MRERRGCIYALASFIAERERESIEIIYDRMGPHLAHYTTTHATCYINCVVSWVAISKSESQCDRRRRRRMNVDKSVGVVRLIFKIFWWLIGNWILTRTWCCCCFVSFPLINWLPPSPSSTSSKFDLSRVVTFIFSSFSFHFMRLSSDAIFGTMLAVVVVVCVCVVKDETQTVKLCHSIWVSYNESDRNIRIHTADATDDRAQVCVFTVQ